MRARCGKMRKREMTPQSGQTRQGRGLFRFLAPSCHGENDRNSRADNSRHENENEGDRAAAGAYRVYIYYIIIGIVRRVVLAGLIAVCFIAVYGSERGGGRLFKRRNRIIGRGNGFGDRLCYLRREGSFVRRGRYSAGIAA